MSVNDRRRDNEGNPQCMIPVNTRSPEEAFRIRSMAGKASGVSKRAKKDFRTFAEEILNCKVNYPLGELKTLADLDKKFVKTDGSPKPITVSQRILIAMAQKAIAGDVSAAIFLRDSSGNKPVDVIKADLTATNFNITWGDITTRIAEETIASEMNQDVIIEGEDQ